MTVNEIEKNENGGSWRCHDTQHNDIQYNDT
jgi:hypothetical protein